MATDTRLLRALRALLPALLPREPFAYPRRYRVVRAVPALTPDAAMRAELQIVKQATGFPDMLAVSAWPGVPGAAFELAPSAEVLVEFIDGDPQQPYVSAYKTPDDPHWRPVTSKLSATDSIEIDATTVKVGPNATSVELGSGSDSVAPGADVGRVVRFGDVIMMPVGTAGTLTAMAIQGAKLGDVMAPVGPIDVSKVKA